MMKNKTKPTLRICVGLLFLAPLLGMVLPGCGESAEEQARAQEIAKKQAEVTEKALAAKKAEELAKKKAIKQATERMVEILVEIATPPPPNMAGEDYDNVKKTYYKSRTKLLSEMEELAKSGKVDFNAKISYPAFKEKHSLKQILLLAKLANPPELENNPMGGLGKFLLTAGLGVNLDLGLTSKQINTLLQAMWSANPKDLKAIVRNQVEQYYLQEGSCHECVGIEKVQDCGDGEYVGKALVRRISVKNGAISLGKVRAVDINIEVFEKMIQVEVIDFDI